MKENITDSKSIEGNYQDRKSEKVDQSINPSCIQGLSSDAATRNYREAIKSREFKDEIIGLYNESENLKSISPEVKEKYLQNKLEKINQEASDCAKVALNDLKAQNPEKADTFEYLDKQFEQDEYKKLSVLDTFTEVPDVTSNKETTLVNRCHGPDNKVGHFFTKMPEEEINQTPGKLSLPENNLGTDITQFQIKPNSSYLEGTACAKFNHEGGGNQIFVADLGDVEEVTK